jgi:hypothetical protein
LNQYGILFLWLCLSFLVAAIGDKRKIGFGWTLFWSLLFSPLVGLIIAFTYDKKDSKLRQDSFAQQKFEYYLELGKKAEYKSNYDVAIDNYMDALYHLDNDYEDLSEKDFIEIEEIKDDILERIEKIKKTNS